jgi:hypothetical protein
MPETQHETLAIQALVSRRCNDLGLNHKKLIRRCGYKNISKGLRRLEQLFAGDFKRGAGLIAMLPAALEVPVDVIKQVVAETQRYLRESEEAAWRAAFRPHAIILTERQRPQPLFVAAVIGVEVLLRVDFDLTAGPATFLRQALDGLRQRLARWHGYLPAYGRATGLIVNYSPDRAIEFDLTGNPIQTLDRAYRLGMVRLEIGGRAISHGELGTLFSGR